jgi:hypothetical protein
MWGCEARRFLSSVEMASPNPFVLDTGAAASRIWSADGDVRRPQLAYHSTIARRSIIARPRFWNVAAQRHKVTGRVISAPCTNKGSPKKWITHLEEGMPTQFLPLEGQGH